MYMLLKGPHEMINTNSMKQFPVYMLAENGKEKIKQKANDPPELKQTKEKRRTA